MLIGVMKWNLDKDEITVFGLYAVLGLRTVISLTYIFLETTTRMDSRAGIQ